MPQRRLCSTVTFMRTAHCLQRIVYLDARTATLTLTLTPKTFFYLSSMAAAQDVEPGKMFLNSCVNSHLPVSVLKVTHYLDQPESLGIANLRKRVR